MKYGDLGRLILRGDFNARCGEVQEYVVKEYGVSVVGEREVIDDRKKNLSGEILLNLMEDHDLCVMNGVMILHVYPRRVNQWWTIV